MANKKKYWKGLEELHDDPDFLKSRNKEFSEQVSVDKVLGDESVMEGSEHSRRDFLKFLGFSVAAASLAACESPVIHAIPYVVKPEDVTPGVADYYASTFYDGHDYCPILVKTREGRPIKIKGNDLSDVQTNATNARVNASILSLYDKNRYQKPAVKGQSTSWTEIDKKITSKLNEVASSGQKIALVTPTIIGPSTNALIEEFKNKFKGENDVVNHVMYDSISYSGMIAANEKSFGEAIIPSYHFDKAKTIVSVGADFLVNWLSSIQNASQYGVKRNPDGNWMSKHYQFESILSVSGANADVRLPVKPSQEGKVLLSIYNIIASRLGVSKLPGDTMKDSKVESAAADLLKSKGESLVISGANDEYIQTLVNGINALLGNYGSTLDLNAPLNIKQGRDKDIQNLISDMKAGKIGAIIIEDVDPVGTLPDGTDFMKAIKKVGTTISIAQKENSTSSLCEYICPNNNFMESWGDANPEGNYYSLQQPVISRLFKTRQFEDSLLKWTGKKQDFYHYLKNYWNKNIIKEEVANPLIEQPWDKTLKNGVYKSSNNSNTQSSTFNGNLTAAAQKLSNYKGAKVELVLYQNTGIGDGQGADNPWLQELPDPITKITWDNYATVSLGDANEMKFNTHYGQNKPTSMIELTVKGKKYNLPVVAQPGQASGTVGIALGYGKKVGKMKKPTGLNAYPFRTKGTDGNISNVNYKVAYDKIGEEYPIACTQTQYTLMGRTEVLKEVTLEDYKTKPKHAYNEPAEVNIGGKKVELPSKKADMWESHPVKKVGHHWGMSIDLNGCIGCGACVVSCTAENNVPIVGKDEVRRVRDMQWIRIDRYYSSPVRAQDAAGNILTRNKEEEPDDENVEVAFEPMLCQQCNHAPCETVCPVAATSHSDEGLNMMTYNRCIGTRYCANNCPYKVRRFNWWSYQHNAKFKDVNPSQDSLSRFVLNPDVTVRGRGVMEKCTFCIQRIQAGKLTAKKEGHPVKDGSIMPACAEACPTNAITFGDLNDVKSKVSKKIKEKRAFRVLEELGTKPNVYYQVKVRNSDQVRVTI